MCRSARACELGRRAGAQAEAGLAAVAAARARALEDLDQAISQSLELLGGPTDPAAPEALAADRVIAANARRALALMKALQARVRVGAPTYCSYLLRAERVALPCGDVVSPTCVVRSSLCLRLCSIAVRHNYAPPVPPVQCRAHAQLFFQIYSSDQPPGVARRRPTRSTTAGCWRRGAGTAAPWMAASRRMPSSYREARQPPAQGSATMWRPSAARGICL
jgi:hypothetical protein